VKSRNMAQKADFIGYHFSRSLRTWAKARFGTATAGQSWWD
jgi:hypothetical protein